MLNLNNDERSIVKDKKPYKQTIQKGKGHFRKETLGG